MESNYRDGPTGHKKGFILKSVHIYYVMTLYVI